MPSDSPELHPVHKPHGWNWGELLLSVAALVTSAMSVVIALRHGEVMDKMLKANSLPFLTIYSGNDVNGKSVAHFTLRNEGVGPARVMSLRLSLDGKKLHNLDDFLKQCCGGHAPEGNLDESNAYERFIPARGESELFSLSPESDKDPAYKAFDQARGRLQVQLCYCSVFNECYEYVPMVAEATPVAACPIDQTADFVP
jgi:hypothetical protein